MYTLPLGFAMQLLHFGDLALSGSPQEETGNPKAITGSVWQGPLAVMLLFIKLKLTDLTG